MIDFLLGVPGKLKTIADRLTATRAANLDNLDAAISTRAPSSTALSNATWTNARAAYLDKLASTPADSAPISWAGFQDSGMSGTTNFVGNGTIAATTTSTTYVDVVNITGAGIMEFLAFHNTNTGGTIKLVIDGVTVQEFTRGSTSNWYMGEGGVVVSTVGGVDRTYCIPCGRIPFKNSLLIQHKATSGNTATTRYKWYRTE